MTRTCIRTRIKISAFITGLLFCALPLHAKRTALEGFSSTVCLDIPEGYGITETGDEGNYYMLQNSVSGCRAIIRVYPSDRFENSREALETTLKNLNLSFEADTFDYHEQTAAIAVFKGNFLNEEVFGYSTSIKVQENGKYLTLLSWCREDRSIECNSFLTSFIDAQYIDDLSYFDKGPLTAYTVPESGTKTELTLTIGGKTISTYMDESACEGASYTVAREYEVLLFYQNAPSWKQAWQRYYRLIFRDACTRLQQASFDIYNTLAPECEDETDYAQKILAWTQGFTYQRETNSADFTSLPDAVAGKGCDCDTRSLLVAVMLQSMNIDSIIFVSSEFSHAIAGLNSTHPGFSFKTGEKNYLTGETTVPGLTWGRLSADIADQSRWIPVVLP